MKSLVYRNRFDK